MSLATVEVSFKFELYLQGPKKWFATKGGPRQEQAIFSGSVANLLQEKTRQVQGKVVVSVTASHGTRVII